MTGSCEPSLISESVPCRGAFCIILIILSSSSSSERSVKSNYSESSDANSEEEEEEEQDFDQYNKDLQLFYIKTTNKIANENEKKK